jgi:hypothetical protein
MKKRTLAVLGCLILCAGCQSSGQHRRLSTDLKAGKEPSPLAEVLKSMPSTDWEIASSLRPKTDYLSITGDPSYYLFRGGIQFIDERSALRYTTDARGFELLTIEQKDGLYKNPVCPADTFAFTCVENHSIIIATKVSCSFMACDYDFVVFDYERKFRFMDDSPALKTIINFMLGEEEATFYFPYRYKKEFEIKHQRSGNITAENPLWVDYLRERRDLIRGRMDRAASEYSIRIVEHRRAH